MTNEEAIIYFKQCNSRIVSVCKDENEYDYEKQEIISDCARKTYEANRLAIKALESEPKTGHWIGHREHCENLGVMPSGLGVYEWCSNCDCGIDVREWHRNPYNFCPNCGADMRGAK